MSKDQINLPKTAFSMKANLPIREPEILSLWNKINLYQELLELLTSILLNDLFALVSQGNGCNYIFLLMF